jgi:hypothetical protein
MSAKDSFSCACGDKSYRAVRKETTWQDQGFWCSTVMSMMNWDGTLKYVWNPYSLAELESMLSGTLDTYLRCVATGGTCVAPTAPIFESQQVSMISVYQRCLANYQSRQWDLGTHALFNRSLTPQGAPEPPCYQVSGMCIGNCLLDAQSQGASNAVCLDMWLSAKGVNSLDYFQYEEGTPTHACQVFSGPAKLEGSVGEPFRACMEEYETPGAMCKLPSIVWSGRSTNKVPVALDHSTVIADPAEKVAAARGYHASIKQDVQQVLNDLQALNGGRGWNASSLDISIFSAEGDLLHQFFDCFMMGALDSVDMWPGVEERPVWNRNNDSTRSFQLPCSGEALRDRSGKRDSKSPFTCGSWARRSVIKYFLRNVAVNNPSENQNIITNAVQQLLTKLKEVWVDSDLNTYMCQCKDGTNSHLCCTLDSSCDPQTKCECEDGSEPSFRCCECKDSSLLPPRFRVEFTKVQGSNLMDTLFDQIVSYLNSTVWTSNLPWQYYDDYSYEWGRASEDLFMFDTVSDIQSYSELGYPYRTTVWEMCHGLLQQVIYTMPVVEGKPTSLGAPFDPDLSSTTVNMTYKEEFVQQLVADAYRKSPLYWHYVARHKPSASAMCKRGMVKPSTTNLTLLVHGYNALKVGGYDTDCYCGWWHNSTHCKIPSSVCERLVLLVGTQEVRDACTSGGFTRSAHVWMERLIQLEGGWRGWPCPSMYISDHWGLLTDAWVKGVNDESKTQDLILRNGTSGLRVGSLTWLKQVVVDHINPAERRESVQSLQCDLAPPSTLVDHFVDELFPAAQGVRQSAATSACLRFTIELARLSAYKEAGLTIAAAEQTSVVGLWRSRCDMKLQQVTFCQVYGVFKVKNVTTNCPFKVLASFVGTYSVTPACLIVFQDKVYDPCLCDSKWCSTSSFVLNLFTLTQSCALLHVQDLVLDRSNGLPPWPFNSAGVIPQTLARSSFYSRVLQDGTNIANSNTHWASAEGESFQYCDYVVDWWPDAWRHPVGYHVTLPCSGAAHRTFDAAWAALRVGKNVTMMHVPNALRNRTLQNNMFGAAGACRTHNYGMPMKVMNSMRLCTKADERAVDPAVPLSASASATVGQEYCSDSPFQVPWANGPVSVGTFFDYLVDMAPFSEWGNQAGHAALKTCTSDSECCPTCKCLRGKGEGICSQAQCYQHQHCGNQMCAGDGRCAEPVLEFFNNASFDVVTRTFTEGCRQSVKDSWGTSKEDLVVDLLENSGMCSYRCDLLLPRSRGFIVDCKIVTSWVDSNMIKRMHVGLRPIWFSHD